MCIVLPSAKLVTIRPGCSGRTSGLPLKPLPSASVAPTPVVLWSLELASPVPASSLGEVGNGHSAVGAGGRDVRARDASQPGR
jgi:hypothetical protein